MSNLELIGVCVGVDPHMRIQLIDDHQAKKFVVKNLNTNGGIESEVKNLSYADGDRKAAFVAALDLFTSRIRSERESYCPFTAIEEFALIMNPEGDQSEDTGCDVYLGSGATIISAINMAEAAVAAAGKYDIEALRSMPEYSSGIAALAKVEPESDEPIGIALLIR